MADVVSSETLNVNSVTQSVQPVRTFGDVLIDELQLNGVVIGHVGHSSPARLHLAR